MKFVYPACFYPEENGQYSVVVPDLNGAATYGNNLDDAINMSKDLISGLLLEAVHSNEVLPKASSESDITLEYEKGFVSLIEVDLDEYKNKVVKWEIMLYKCEQMFYTKEGLYNAYEAFIVYSKILPQRIYFRFGSWQHGLFFYA